MRKRLLAPHTYSDIFIKMMPYLTCDVYSLENMMSGFKLLIDYPHSLFAQELSKQLIYGGHFQKVYLKYLFWKRVRCGKVQIAAKS